MSRKFDSPITLSIGASRQLAILIALAYGGAIVLSFTVPFPWWASATAAAVLLWRGRVALRLHALRLDARSIVQVSLDDAGRHSLRRRGDAADREFRVLTRFIDPRLTILTVRSDDRRFAAALLVAGDAVEGEEFRRWRARLRLQTSAE